MFIAERLQSVSDASNAKYVNEAHALIKGLKIMGGKNGFDGWTLPCWAQIPRGRPRYTTRARTRATQGPDPGVSPAAAQAAPGQQVRFLRIYLFPGIMGRSGTSGPARTRGRGRGHSGGGRGSTSICGRCSAAGKPVEHSYTNCPLTSVFRMSPTRSFQGSLYKGLNFSPHFVFDRRY